MEDIVIFYKPLKTKKGIINAILVLSPLWLYFLLIVHSVMTDENFYTVGFIFIPLWIIIFIILIPILNWEVIANKYQIIAQRPYGTILKVKIDNIKKATFKAPLWLEHRPAMILELKDGSQKYFLVLGIVPEVLALLKSLGIPIEVNPRRSRKWKKRLDKFNLLDE
ncbi:MAG: hypothetical protein ACPG19_02205 [Saprospiraceae bacterium]